MIRNMKIKQLFHFVLACSLMLTAAACTDEVVTNEGNGTDSTDVPEGMQALTLKVGGITGGSVTKASVIAKPEEIAVNDMTIYVFKYDPALGDDDTDDNNYTYLDYWTYSNADPALTGYTANNRQAHTFTLGGSGQYRTATIYIPKEAGKVKCYVVTGNPVLSYIETERGSLAPLSYVDATNAWLASGIGIAKTSVEEGYNEVYAFNLYSLLSNSPLIGQTLSFMKKDFLNVSKYFAISGGSSAEGTGTAIPADYWDTPLSMSGESNILDIKGQSGNSSVIDATLRRHVARLDIINNSLAIDKIEIINLPVMTTFSQEGIDLLAANTGLLDNFVGAPNNRKTNKTETEPADSYTLFTLYDHTAAAGEAYFKAITRYVYPNVPKELDATSLYTPFIRVTEKGNGTPYILPLQSKNEDGSFTRIDLQANHRYSLVINKLGDNFVDYNIIVEDWQAGADFSVHLGQDITEEQINYMPAITEKVAYKKGTNDTNINEEMNNLLVRGEQGSTPKWQFYTSATLKNINIIECTSPGGIGSGKLISTVDNGYTSEKNTDVPDNPKYKHTQTTPSTLQYSTRWLALQNPYNITNYSMVKAEYITPQDKISPNLGVSLILLNETNEYETVDAGTQTVPFTPGSYYTEWPETGYEGYNSEAAENAKKSLLENSFNTYLLSLLTLTESDYDQGLDMSSLKYGIKKGLYPNELSYYLVSNGNSDLPCSIALMSFLKSTPYTELMMWERVQGNDGVYYIKMTACYGPDLAGLAPTSFEGLRSLVRNIENGKNKAYGSITRYFPEGNYWLNLPKAGQTPVLLSFHYQTFGKRVADEGATGFMRKMRDRSTTDK